MIVTKPPKYIYKCQCQCGAEFIAFEEDVKYKSILVRDPLYEPGYNYGYGSSTIEWQPSVISCPFCKSYHIVEDSGYMYKKEDLLQDFDKKGYKNLKVEKVESTSCKILTDKYPDLKTEL